MNRKSPRGTAALTDLKVVASLLIQWLFQGHPAESKFLAASKISRFVAGLVLLLTLTILVPQARGQTPTPQLLVRGLSVTILNGDTTPTAGDNTHFGNVTVCDRASKTQTFTIFNFGMGALTVTGISSSNPSEFQVGPFTFPVVIAGGGAWSTFTVTFAPSAPGLRTATISIANDDSTANPYSFAIAGNGIAPAIDIAGGNPLIPILNDDITPMTGDGTDFGSVVVSNSSSPHLFTITNGGTAPLTLTGITSSNAEFLSGPMTFPVIIAAGGATTFTVIFNPGTIGLRTGTLMIASDDCAENSYDFAVKGNGTTDCETGPNLVANGSFEVTNPVVAANNFNNSLDPLTGVPGWTTTPGKFLEVWSNTTGGVSASDGVIHMELNAQSDDQTVSQVITGLRTDCETTFSFDYTGRFGDVGGTPNNDFIVTLSGGYILSVPLNPSAYAVSGWTKFSVTFVANSPTLTIGLRGKPHFSDGTIFTQGGAHVDNVSVTQCCDADPDPCVAGETWTPHETNRPWTSIDSSVDGGKLVAVAYQGQIYTSTDSGLTWTARESNRSWCSVASSADGTKLVALVNGGRIYTSTDSGGTWTARESNRNWSDVASSADGSKLVAVVSNGQIFTSADFGVTWTARETSRSWECVASSADGSMLVAGVSAYGQISTSADSGVTWTARESNRVWKSVASSADGSKLVAVALYDQIFTSPDFGVTWTARENSRSWVSVASSGDGSRLVALNNGGQIYISPDSGATWIARENNRDWLSVASSADGSKLVAVVSGGQIYTSECAETPIVNCPADKTVDCGSAWTFDEPTGVDACSGGSVEVFILSTKTSGSCPRQITRTWQITDDCGNTSECSQTVTLVDNAPPVIACPPKPIIVALNQDCQLEIPTIQPFASDNCTPRGGLIYMQDPPAGAIMSGPCQSVTVTVMDACNNVSRCAVTVCGADKTPPVLICPKSITVTDCTVPDVLALVSASDNCTSEGRLVFTQSPLAGTSSAAGGNMVTVTVTDEAGNASTCFIPLTNSGPQSFLNVMFNTGVNSNKAILPFSSVDPHYTISSVPVGTPTGPGFYNAPNSLVGPHWMPLSSALSEWISLYGNNSNHQYPVGLYTYTSQFVLPSGMNSSTASISGRWSAGNGGKMYVNGSLIPASNIPTPPFGSYFGSWQSFTINSGFLSFPAVNTITFVVEATGQTFSWGGRLRVEYTDALINCNTCTPPVVLEKPRPQSLPLNGTAVFHANVSGTPPFSIQWFHNNLPLSNGGHYSGVNTATLTVTPLSYADAGIYHAVISNPCGEISSPPAQLTIRKGLPWWWAWWNFDQIGKPMQATVGSDLVLVPVGNDYPGISSGTASDFGLPNGGGRPTHVMHVPALPVGTIIRLPFAEAPDDEPVDGYTLIADIYIGDSDGRSMISTIFDRWGKLEFEIVDQAAGPVGPGGRRLNLSGNIDGALFDLPCFTLLNPNQWNRVALVVDGTACGSGGPNMNQACGEVTFKLYLNGRLDGTITVTPENNPPSITSGSVLTVFSSQAGTTSGLFVDSLQFHHNAFTSERMAEIGGPDSGPIAVKDPSAGLTPGGAALSALPALSVLKAGGGILELSWSNVDGSDFLLEETSDLATGLWMPCLLPFSQAGMNSRQDITTTVYADPTTQGPRKFYRLKGTELWLDIDRN